MKINPTGINELDEILNGGIPEGHVVLLSGNSGSGKTILAMNWLCNNPNIIQEKGLYITLTEPVNKTIENLNTLEIYNKNAKDNLTITDLRSIMNNLDIDFTSLDKQNIDDIIEKIKDIIINLKCKRVVIDSITAIAQMIGDKNLIRYLIFKIGRELSFIKCTTFLISESNRNDFSAFGVEEFISDSIIKLDYSFIDGLLIRNLVIYKMRGVDYDNRKHIFTISKYGIIINKLKSLNINYGSLTDLKESFLSIPKINLKTLTNNFNF